jgi:hypothetical protein
MSDGEATRLEMPLESMEREAEREQLWAQPLNSGRLAAEGLIAGLRTVEEGGFSATSRRG